MAAQHAAIGLMFCPLLRLGLVLLLSSLSLHNRCLHGHIDRWQGMGTPASDALFGRPQGGGQSMPYRAAASLVAQWPAGMRSGSLAARERGQLPYRLSEWWPAPGCC